MATDDITVRGTVQDVGFRDRVETLDRLHGLQGSVYNEPSGTVGITAQGSDEAVENFVAAVREQAERLSATVDAIERRPVDGDPSLPAGFFEVPTDELADIGRKLDEGI
ncbi:MAG: acylphosphatase [Halobacteriales archaeon]